MAGKNMSSLPVAKKPDPSMVSNTPAEALRAVLDCNGQAQVVFKSLGQMLEQVSDAIGNDELRGKSRLFCGDLDKFARTFESATDELAAWFKPVVDGD